MHHVDFPSQQELAAALNPNFLHLIIFPTEDCNFRCSYCYEDHIPGKMSPDIVHGIKRLIERRMSDLKHIKLSWFGGEPLLAKLVVFDLCEFVEGRCRENGCNQLPGNMTTNAYFLNIGVMERLCAAGQTQFHVSIDGVGAAHNKSRPLASGKGTFDRIWANLQAFHQSNLSFDLVLRVHYGFLGDDETRKLCVHLNANFGGDNRFRVLFERVADLGGKNSGTFTPIPVEDALASARSYVSLLPDLTVIDVDTADSGICEAARPNSLLIRTDGRINKCAVNLSDPRNEVGRLGRDGRIEFNGRLHDWFQGYAQIDKDILTCPYQWVRQIEVVSYT